MKDQGLHLSLINNQGAQKHRDIPLTILTIYKKALNLIVTKKLKLTASIIQDKGMYYLYFLDMNGIEKMRILFLRGIEATKESILSRASLDTMLFPLTVESKKELVLIHSLLEKRIERV